MKLILNVNTKIKLSPIQIRYKYQYRYFDRTRMYLGVRQQSKTEREKRSVYYYVKQTIANKLYPSTVHSPQHSTVPVSIPRLDTPGVRLKGTRVST